MQTDVQTKQTGKLESKRDRIYREAREIFGGSAPHLTDEQRLQLPCGVTPAMVEALVDLRHLPGIDRGDTFEYWSRGSEVHVDKTYAVGRDANTTRRAYRWTALVAPGTVERLVQVGLIEKYQHASLGESGTRYRLSRLVIELLPVSVDHPQYQAWLAWLKQRNEG